MNAAALKMRADVRAPARHAFRARETLVLRHTYLVRRIAYHYARRMPRYVEVDDLIQAGMIGLLEAAQRYESRAGAAFETFAGVRIRGAILDSIRGTDWSPRWLRRRLRDIELAKWRIESTTGRATTPADVAAAIGVSLKDYHRALQASEMQRLVSLDDPSTADDGPIHSTVVDERLGPAGELELEDLRRTLAAALDALPETERVILTLYYDHNRLLREIGDQLALSESRICQIRGRAVKRLRDVVDKWRAANGAAQEPANVPVLARGSVP